MSRMQEIMWSQQVSGSKAVQNDLKRMVWEDEKKLASLTLGLIHNYPNIQAVQINNSLTLEGPEEERQAVLREAKKRLEEASND